MPLIPGFLLEGRDLRIPQKTERIPGAWHRKQAHSGETPLPAWVEYVTDPFSSK